ncbi:MAG: response regulator [Spirochaetaceae bacterium]|nr:response regulator [Spirochaetaceae bacterium]
MNKKVVLAIDDMATELSIIAAALQPHFDVRVSKSAGGALNFLQNEIVDIILLDIEMPGMSGFEFLHEIKKSQKLRHIPVLVVSSHSDQAFFDHAKQSGAADCVAKPIVAEALLKKVNEVLANPPEVPYTPFS